MSSSSFRLNAKDLFLTYPQCDARPEDVYPMLRGVLKDLSFAAICVEQHEDGHPHLHAIVHLTKRCNLRRADCLDLCFPGGRIFHGNYQAVRSKRACLKYVEKDGDCRFFDTTMEACRAYFGGGSSDGSSDKRSKLGLAFERLLDGAHIAELMQDSDLTSTCVMHQDKLLKALNTVKVFRSRKKKERFVRAECITGGEAGVRLTTWLNDNVGKERLFATKQMYLHGPTMHGKTSLVMELMKCLRIYSMPYGVEYYDFYNDEDVDIIVLDEYKAQKTIQFLNSLLEGSPLFLNQKNGGTMKTKNVPVLILSNWSLREVYRKVDDAKLETLERRLEQIMLTEPLSLRIITEIAE